MEIFNSSNKESFRDTCFVECTAVSWTGRLATSAVSFLFNFFILLSPMPVTTAPFSRGIDNSPCFASFPIKHTARYATSTVCVKPCCWSFDKVGGMSVGKMFQVSEVLLRQTKYNMVFRTEKNTHNSNTWCVDYSIQKGKGKVIPLQARCGPEGG